MTNPIRLMIVDDQRLMRQGLRTLLELEGGFEIVAEAADGQAALDAYAELQPDVALMDIRMPGMDSGSHPRLRQQWPDARVIISPHLTTMNTYLRLCVGALGYFLRIYPGTNWQMLYALSQMEAR
jgi:DNA-binding NarL/FixJ family response regulator